jgi:hypothetical protein
VAIPELHWKLFVTFTALGLIAIFAAIALYRGINW